MSIDLNNTLAKYCTCLSQKYGDRVALATSTYSITYREMDEKSTNLAIMLMRKGVKPGDHVGLWSSNSCWYMIAFFGILKAGAVGILFDGGLTGEEVTQLGSFADMNFLLYGKTKDLMRQNDKINYLSGKTGFEADRILNIEQDFDFCVTQEERSEIIKRIEEHKKSDDALIMFTTGTQTIPKAVVLSDYNIMVNLGEVERPLERMKREDICLALPLHHSYGLLVLLIFLYVGGSVHLPEMYIPDIIIPMIEKYHITIIGTVSPVLIGLQMHRDFKTKVDPYLELCTLGGGFYSPQQFIEAENMCSKAKLINGYGMTECAAFVSLMSPWVSQEIRSKSVGYAYAENIIKIMGKDGAMLPSGEIGEIVIKGPNLMKGYYKVPKEEQPFFADGWFHTEDLGYLDDEGFLYMTGRVKDIISRAGENVAPFEVEEAFLKLPEIAEVKVFGLPDEILGEKITACVVLKNGVCISVVECLEKVRNLLSATKYPDELHIFAQLPKKENHKIDMVKLKEML